MKKGAAVRPGQELVVECPVERADFARRVVEAGYRAGAGHVTVIWDDDAISRLTYENVDVDWFRHTPSWKVEQLNSLATFLFLEGSNPSALKGIDPAKPAAASKARNTECKSFRDGMDFGRNVWCIAGVPVAAWAREVFPGTSDAEATYRLWNLILSVARADGDDPESAWETHNASFEKTKRFLNGHRFDALRYEASNGTNLVVGMNPGLGRRRRPHAGRHHVLPQHPDRGGLHLAGPRPRRGHRVLRHAAGPRRPDCARLLAAL